MTTANTLVIVDRGPSGKTSKRWYAGMLHTGAMWTSQLAEAVRITDLAEVRSVLDRICSSTEGGVAFVEREDGTPVSRVTGEPIAHGDDMAANTTPPPEWAYLVKRDRTRGHGGPKAAEYAAINGGWTSSIRLAAVFDDARNAGLFVSATTQANPEMDGQLLAVPLVGERARDNDSWGDVEDVAAQAGGDPAAVAFAIANAVGGGDAHAADPDGRWRAVIARALQTRAEMRHAAQPVSDALRAFVNDSIRVALGGDGVQAMAMVLTAKAMSAHAQEIEAVRVKALDAITAATGEATEEVEEAGKSIVEEIEEKAGNIPSVEDFPDQEEVEREATKAEEASEEAEKHAEAAGESMASAMDASKEACNFRDRAKVYHDETSADAAACDAHAHNISAMIQKAEAAVAALETLKARTVWGRLRFILRGH